MDQPAVGEWAPSRVTGLPFERLIFDCIKRSPPLRPPDIGPLFSLTFRTCSLAAGGSRAPRPLEETHWLSHKETQTLAAKNRLQLEETRKQNYKCVVDARSCASGRQGAPARASTSHSLRPCLCLPFSPSVYLLLPLLLRRPSCGFAPALFSPTSGKLAPQFQTIFPPLSATFSLHFHQRRAPSKPVGVSCDCGNWLARRVFGAGDCLSPKSGRYSELKDHVWRPFWRHATSDEQADKTIGLTNWTPKGRSVGLNRAEQS